MPPEQPNIMWLVSEDNSCFIGSYGDQVARTPTIDGLADDGIRFDNAFSAAPVCAPSRFSIITGLHPASVPGAEHMRAADVSLPGSVRPFPAYLRDAGYFCTNASKTDYNARIPLEAVWDECGDNAHWRHRSPDQPFFSVFNYLETHESCLFEDHHTPETDPAEVRVPGYLPDTPTIRIDLARYYDHVATLDGLLRDRLHELEADGLAADTIVFYYSDHGGVLPRSKRFCYDSGLRVPLIVRVPPRWRTRFGLTPGPTRELVSLMDLGPTALSLAGLRPPPGLHGRAIAGPHRAAPPPVIAGGRGRMDERYDLVRTVRDQRYRYLRNYRPCLPAGQHLTYMWRQPSVRAWKLLHDQGSLTERQSRFWEHKPYEELYDLATDPDETENLANSPEHAAHLERLRDELDRHMVHIQDTGFLIEDAATTDRYPLAKVMAVADSAARHLHANYTSELADPSEAVRYWATYGVASAYACDQHPAAEADLRTASRNQLTRCLSDSSPAVRITAAEALATQEATETLIALLRHDSATVRLRSMNAIDRLLAHGRFDGTAKNRIRATIGEPGRFAGGYLGNVTEQVLAHLG